MNTPQSRECQFDATTKKLANEYANEVAVRFSSVPDYEVCRHDVQSSARYAYCDGRNSAKASLEILARAVEFYSKMRTDHYEALGDGAVSRKAIAEVLARVEWPLEGA